MYTDFKPIQKEQLLFPFDLNYGMVSIGLDINFVTTTTGKWPLVHLKTKPTFFYIRRIRTCQFIGSSRVLMDNSLFYVSFTPCLFPSVLQPRRVTLLSFHPQELQATQQHWVWHVQCWLICPVILLI